MSLLSTFSFAAVAASFNTSPVACVGWDELCVGIHGVETGDGRTLAFDIQFSPSADPATTAWSSAATGSQRTGLANTGPLIMIAQNLTIVGGPFGTSPIIMCARVPVMGPQVRLAVTVAGTTSTWDVNVSFLGIPGVR